MALMTEDEERRFNNQTMTQNELDVINAEINSGTRKSEYEPIIKNLSDEVSVIGTKECVKDITLETIKNLDVPTFRS